MVQQPLVDAGNHEAFPNFSDPMDHPDSRLLSSETKARHRRSSFEALMALRPMHRMEARYRPACKLKFTPELRRLCAI